MIQFILKRNTFCNSIQYTYVAWHASDSTATSSLNSPHSLRCSKWGSCSNQNILREPLNHYGPTCNGGRLGCGSSAGRRSSEGGRSMVNLTSRWNRWVASCTSFPTPLTWHTYWLWHHAGSELQRDPQQRRRVLRNRVRIDLGWSYCITAQLQGRRRRPEPSRNRPSRGGVPPCIPVGM